MYDRLRSVVNEKGGIFAHWTDSEKIVAALLIPPDGSGNCIQTVAPSPDEPAPTRGISMTTSDQPAFSKSIVRVTILTPDPTTNQLRPVEYYDKYPTKRRGSRLLRPLERLVRQTAESRKVAADEYLDRHNRSNERKRNGWLRDLGRNVYKSMRAARKKRREADDEDDD